MEYFVNNVDYLYKDQQMPMFLKALITLFTIVVISSLSYLYTEKQYDYPDFDVKIQNLKTLMSIRKKQVKGKEYDEDEFKNAESFCKTDLQNDAEHNEFHKILNVLVEYEANIANKDIAREDKLEKIIQLEDELEKKIRKFQNRMGYKWIALIGSFMATFIVVYWIILPTVNFMFLSSKESTELRDVIKGFVPEGINITDIMEDKDLMITAWDINNRSPRFFSKTNF